MAEPTIITTNVPVNPAFDEAGQSSAVMQIKRAKGERFLNWEVIGRIRDGDYASTMVRFGDGAPVPLGNITFDLNKPDDCYDLCQRICEQNRTSKQGYAFRFTSETPIFVITPKPVRFIRTNDLQDPIRNGDTEFSTCTARGRKGEKSVKPVITGENTVACGDYETRQHHVLATYGFTLIPTEDNLYRLEIDRPDIGDMFTHPTYQAPSRTVGRRVVQLTAKN